MTPGPASGGSGPTVAVVGLGLMGGSLCRALKTSDDPPYVIGLDVDPAQGEAAEAAGAIDRFGPRAEDSLHEATTVVYATPLGATVSLLREHASIWREDVLVTDMVSLKLPVMRAVAERGFAHVFVGAHPICGGESSGFAAGRADLFRAAPVWLCAGEDAGPELRGRAESFWAGVGGAWRWADPGEHDRDMAWVSHLPQLVSNALAGALDAAGYTPSELGPGGRDMTRLAGSNPSLWKDLLAVSAPAVGTGLTSVSNALNVLADLLARRDIDRIAEFMETTRRWRGEGE